MASNNSTCSCNVKNNLRSMIGYRYDSDHDFYEQLKKAIYYDGETYIGVCKRLIELIGSGCCHGKVDVNADREAAADWVDDFRDEVAGMLGIACNGMVDDVQDAVMVELEKRLMPPGMEWPPKDSEGEDLSIGDKAHFLRTENQSHDRRTPSKKKWKSAIAERRKQTSIPRYPQPGTRDVDQRDMTPAERASWKEYLDGMEES